MNRIIDANLNRVTEGLRVLEEIARFFLDSKELSEDFKNIRHQICAFFDTHYEKLLNSRDTLNDVGTSILNPSKRKGLESIFKANIKRVEQALRVLSEYGSLSDDFRYKIYILEEKMFGEIKLKLRKYLLEGKKLYLVTNSDKFETEDEFLNSVALALKSGVDIVQLREKTKNANEIIRLGKKIRELASIYGAIFIVNDRIDIAQIVEADGVHLGQDDISPIVARKMLGERAIIGVSTHCPEHAQKAIEDGADYIGVGPVFKTPTKPDKNPVGLDYVKWASENVNIPFYAIGAINLENLDEVCTKGAYGVAVIREIMYSKDIEKTVFGFKKHLV